MSGKLSGNNVLTIIFFLHVHFIRINNGCSNCVESADWLQLLTEISLWGKYFEPVFIQNLFGGSAEIVSFKIILNTSKVERLQKKHDIATVRSAIFNLAPCLDLYHIIPRGRVRLLNRVSNLTYREDYSTQDFHRVRLSGLAVHKGQTDRHTFVYIYMY